MVATEPTIEETGHAWDRIAPRFDRVLGATATQNAELALAHVTVTPGTRVLDIGCGTGALAIPAARLGAEVTAVDVSPAMIELLGKRAAEAGVQVEGRVMDAHHLDLPEDSVDLAVSQNGVTMSPRLDQTLAEMLRVVRPGGQVLVAAFGPLPQVEFLSVFFAGVRAAVPGFAGLPTDPPPPPFQVAAPAALAAALTAAGARDVTVRPVTWQVPVRSARDLWEEVTASNPLGAQVVAGLSAQQQEDTLEALDWLLRQRFAGRPGGVLPALVNVGVARA